MCLESPPLNSTPLARRPAKFGEHPYHEYFFEGRATRAALGYALCSPGLPWVGYGQMEVLSNNINYILERWVYLDRSTYHIGRLS